MLLCYQGNPSYVLKDSTNTHKSSSPSVSIYNFSFFFLTFPFVRQEKLKQEIQGWCYLQGMGVGIGEQTQVRSKLLFIF